MQLQQFPEQQTFKQLYRDHNVVPVCREILADCATPVSVLEKIGRDAGPAILLESVEGGERWGRFSFLSTSARTHVRIFKDVVEIRKNGRSQAIEHQNDPFGMLRDFMKGYHPANVKGLPRFWGGLVGYITYEAVSFFEAIGHQWPPEKPLAHFVMPDEVLIFDNVRNTLQIIAIAYTSDDPNPDSAFVRAIGRLDELHRDIMKPYADPPQVMQPPMDLKPTYGEADFKSIGGCITCGGS